MVNLLETFEDTKRCNYSYFKTRPNLFTIGRNRSDPWFSAPAYKPY